MNYPLLFEKGKIGSLELSNRIVMTAMETGMGDFLGNPTDLTINYFSERAKDGPGLIITGITRVNEIHGVAAPRQLSLAHDRNIEPMKKLTRRIHETGTKILCQLHHPGRQNYAALIYIWPVMGKALNKLPVIARYFKPLVTTYVKIIENTYTPAVRSASDVACGIVKQKTRPLSTSAVKKLVAQFIHAAQRAKKAEFDGVEIHASHGYLIQQFLSSRTNKRKDIYGGSFENRLRILKEILQGIKNSCGEDYPVIVRLTVEEFYHDCTGSERGIELEEGIRLAKALEEYGADAIDVSSGSYETANKWIEPVTYTPGWRKYLADEVKKAVTIPVIAANLIRSASQAEQQLTAGAQDFIGLGRPFLADPYWVKKVREGREDEIASCINCLHCFESLINNAWAAQPLECARNPFLGREADVETVAVDGKGKKAVVIGGGPAGLTAAEGLARRGYGVTVLEKNKVCGGQVNLAKIPPGKLRIGCCIEEMVKAAGKQGAEIRTNTEATLALIKELNPDLIIYAAGSNPAKPAIKGIYTCHVYTVDDILGKKVSFKGKKVAVVGSGLTGLETAAYLADAGNKITVIELLDIIGPSVHYQHMQDVLEKLPEEQVQYLTSHKLTEIRNSSLVLTNLNNKQQVEIEADAVVMATGNISNRALYDQLIQEFSDVRIIGDALKPGKIADAVTGGVIQI